MLIEAKPGQGALVVGVTPGGAASEAGLAPGDLILSANGKPVRSAKEFQKLARKTKPGDLAVLYLQRGPGRRVFVPVRPLA